MQNPNKASFNFFMKEWGDKRIMIHSECVIEACQNMIKGTDLKEEVFVIAGWVHDLGIKTDKDSHHKIGLSVLDKFLEENPEFEGLKEEISDCILNHRTKGSPKTIYGKIFQVADKVALHNNKWIELKNSTS